MHASRIGATSDGYLYGVRCATGFVCAVNVIDDNHGNYTFEFIGKIRDNERKAIMSAVIAVMP